MNVTVERLADGPGPQVVVIDFAQFSDEKTLADTLAADPRGYRLHLADPVASSAGATPGLRLAELAQAYVEELERLAIRPALVVGNCSAAALALLVAESLYATGQQPAVVLVEPTRITDEHLRHDIGRVRSGLGADGPLPGGLTRDSVLGTLESDLVAKLRADDLPEEDLELCVGMLLERYVSWFGFLFATRHTPIPATCFPFSIIIGQGGAEVAGWEAAVWEAKAATVVRVPVPVAQVPRSSLTVEALLAG